MRNVLSSDFTGKTRSDSSDGNAVYSLTSCNAPVLCTSVFATGIVKRCRFDYYNNAVFRVESMEDLFYYGIRTNVRITHPSIRPRTHACVHARTHARNHSLNHSFTHSFIHPLTGPIVGVRAWRLPQRSFSIWDGCEQHCIIPVAPDPSTLECCPCTFCV